VVFNLGEIAPRGRFYALWGLFCDLRDLGGEFSFQGGDFCRFKRTKIWNCFKEFAISAGLNVLKFGIVLKNFC